MCIAIYLALIGLFIYYSDAVISGYALAITDAQSSPMVVALGWEMALDIWPLLALMVLLGSVATKLALRPPGKRLGGCTNGACAPRD